MDDEVSKLLSTLDLSGSVDLLDDAQQLEGSSFF
jgi:hypothetical protein